MTEIKEQAIDIILKIPDENMTYVMGILRNIEALTAQKRSREKDMERFFSMAGKIQIDSNAIDILRNESMI